MLRLSQHLVSPFRAVRAAGPSMRRTAAVAAALLVLILAIPWIVHAQTPANQSPTGQPLIYPSAEGAGFLLTDTSGIQDPNGLTVYNSNDGAHVRYEDWSYQWIRVDGVTADETDIGGDSPRYQPAAADIGNLIKVQVSFTDNDGYGETVTSLPFGPLAQPAGPSGPPSTLVSNTGQSASATARITQQYAMGFRLGNHGQGYEISSVSIELAAVPSSLTVSLWVGASPGLNHSTVAENKLFDFENPPSFKVGLNTFTAPAGAFAYQNVNHWIVLSGFGSSLSIKETTSDDEDPGGKMGAILFNDARVRALGSTGRWAEQVDPDDDSIVLVAAPTSRGKVLRLSVEGSKRDRGILASNYAQVGDGQETVSLGDKNGFPITLGAADRYLIRGFSYLADTAGLTSPIIHNPFDLRSGWTIAANGRFDSAGTKWFSLTPTRYGSGINVWTAPQGATVAGSGSYIVYGDFSSRTLGSVLTRNFTTSSDDDDTPTAPGVTLSDGVGDFGRRPLMAVLGEPLDAMVSNLGQSNDGHVGLDGATRKVASQGFSTGSRCFRYRLQGIGFEIQDGNSELPDGASSVSVAVHADSNGKPGDKLFDLVSPTEYAAGHSFFEAPPGTTLAPDTSYVVVWSHLGGTNHRLQRTSSDAEDSGARTGFRVANTSYHGADLSSLAAPFNTHSLQIAVYGELSKQRSFGSGCNPVTKSWLHIPDNVTVGYQFRVLFLTHRGTKAESADIDFYNNFVREEAEATYSNSVIRGIASEFRAVVCTAQVDAVTNTGMTADASVPIHWLDGGWQDHPTLIANRNDQFFSDDWVNHDWGAYVTGNATDLGAHTRVWTGCEADGTAPGYFFYYMGAVHGMVAVGTPDHPSSSFTPLGPLVGDREGFVGDSKDRYLPIYAISPILEVVR